MCRGASGKESVCQCRRCKRPRFNPWVGRIPWRRAWQLTPVFLPGESHGQRSLAGYSPEWHRVGHDWSDLAQHMLKGNSDKKKLHIYKNFIFLKIETQAEEAVEMKKEETNEWGLRGGREGRKQGHRGRDSTEKEELATVPEAWGQRIRKKMEVNVEVERSRLENFNWDSLYMLC